MINWSPGVTLDEVEEQVIRKAFTHYRGNKTTTANSLGISIRTLDSRLEKYALEEKKRVEKEEMLQRERDAFLMRARGITVQSEELAVQTEVNQTATLVYDDDVIETTSLKPTKSARGR